MTLQELIRIHNPATIKDADALIKGNYFHHEVIREEYRFGSMRLGYRYEVVKKRVLGVKISSEVAYVFVN